jgi:hypothetical protein
MLEISISNQIFKIFLSDIKGVLGNLQSDLCFGKNKVITL